MSKIDSFKEKSDAELVDTVHVARKAVQDEHFKDTFARKAKVIRISKKDVARALTELNARRRNNVTK